MTEPRLILVKPNQIVAYNLRRARELRGWTMEEAADRLEGRLGALWSKASFSAAERSFLPNNRIRQFTADDLVAFAATFDLPIWWFLMPPPADEHRLSEYRVWLGFRQDEDEDSGEPQQVTVMVSMPALVELILGTDGLGERLAEVFGDEANPGYPQSPHTEVQLRAKELAELAAMAALRTSLTQLSKWAEDLRHLADTLELTSETAEKTASERLHGLAQGGSDR